MNKYKKISLVLIIAMIGLVGIGQTSYGQNVDALANISSEQSIIVVVLGIGAGALVAYQGYRTSSEDWNTLRFFDGLIMSVIGSIPLAIGAAISQTELNLFGYVAIFFSAIGVGYQITQTRKKTVP